MLELNLPDHQPKLPAEAWLNEAKYYFNRMEHEQSSILRGVWDIRVWENLFRYMEASDGE
jgi:hypothetical protein